MKRESLLRKIRSTAPFQRFLLAKFLKLKVYLKLMKLMKTQMKLGRRTILRIAFPKLILLNPKPKEKRQNLTSVGFQGSAFDHRPHSRHRELKSVVSHRLKYSRVKPVDVHLVKTSEFGTFLKHCLHPSVVLENAPPSSAQYKY